MLVNNCLKIVSWFFPFIQKGFPCKFGVLYGTVHIYGTIHIYCNVNMYGTIHVCGYYSFDVKKHY